jgi:tRNA(Arg) A34 adenosine deaminase TadA
MEMAFLVDSKSRPATVYVARHPKGMRMPTSSVIRLIQGIYDVAPEQARRIVRNRIVTNAPLTEMCLGAVRVAAKRVTTLSEAEVRLPENCEIRDVSQSRNALTEALEYERTLSPPTISGQLSSDELMKHAFELNRRSNEEKVLGRPLHQRDRAVAALLVSASGELLSWAVNSNASNRTLHAEVNLIQSYYRKSRSLLPPGSTLVTTLKPCKMCAAMIWHCAQDIRNLSVIYGLDDPGRNARETVLDRHSLERRRASRTEEERELVIQKQVNFV